MDCGVAELKSELICCDSPPVTNILLYNSDEYQQLRQRRTAEAAHLPALYQDRQARACTMHVARRPSPVAPWRLAHRSQLTAEPERGPPVSEGSAARPSRGAPGCGAPAGRCPALLFGGSACSVQWAIREVETTMTTRSRAR